MAREVAPAPKAAPDGASLVELEVQDRDEERAGEEQREEAEEGPAEAKVPALEIVVGHGLHLR